jgi:hypothetical protein
VPDTEQIRKVYETAIAGYADLGLPHIDLRYSESLSTGDFRDLVHVVTNGRKSFRDRWNQLLHSEMPDYCSEASG